LSALVIGYGSIGTRHARLLTELGQHTAVVSSRNVDFPLRFDTLETALANHKPDYVVIANATNLHYNTLTALRRQGYGGVALVEKPLFDRYQVIADEAGQTLVAYNLRFHPVIQRLAQRLRSERILSVQAYAGQYLPGWRPTTDYRESYSANATRGGGVLRDLSHELDYLGWLLGGWSRVTALGGHFSSLEITSDDIFTLLLATPACPVVALQLNYLDRLGRRFIVVNTDQHTIEADLIAGTIQVDGEQEHFKMERDSSYRAMHQAALTGDRTTLCSLSEGLSTMRLIEAAEQSAVRGEWVSR
jgi:predicted dehydrogenase